MIACSSSGSAAAHRSSRCGLNRLFGSPERSCQSGIRHDAACRFMPSRTATGGMAQPTFFKKPPPSTLADIAALTKAQLVDPCPGRPRITGLASLDEAGPMHLTFFDNLKYADQLARDQGRRLPGQPALRGQVPAHVAVLRAAQPFRAFVGSRANGTAMRCGRNPGSAMTASRRRPSSIPRRVSRTA